MTEINWIDGVLAVVLLLSAAFGLFRGLIRGVFGIASLVLAFFVARRFGNLAGTGITSIIGDSAFAVLLGYALTFVAAMLVFGVLTYFIRRMAEQADLGAMDKFGGLLFGLLRGGVFSILIVAVLSSLPLRKYTAWQESVLVPMFGIAVKFAATTIAPADYARYWRFDAKNRPQLVLSNVAAAAQKQDRKNKQRGENDLLEVEDSLTEVKGKAQQRADLLDELNDEIAGQAVNKNASAEKNAQRLKEKLRQRTPLQAAQEAAEEILRQAACDGGECAAEDE